MDTYFLNTPVVFMIFNRPGITGRVFNEIRKAKPRNLYIIADGPRSNLAGEFEKCEETKKIVENIDWECSVHRNYSEINLGCGKRISSGIDWVFSNVGEAIFLEDDCLPDPTFFRYCGELLEYYKNDKRVMFISGNNFQFNRRRSQGSYYFSEFSHVWGWATWKRVWDKYDFNMKSWPKVKENDSFRYWLNSPQAVKYWANIFDKVYDKKIDTWDIQLEFACWSNNGLSIAPEVNLVSNIGFGFDASHTVDSKNKSANIPTTAIEFPLKHPSIIIRDQDADRFEEKTHYLYTITDRIINKIKKIFNL